MSSTTSKLIPALVAVLIGSIAYVYYQKPHQITQDQAPSSKEETNGDVLNVNVTYPVIMGDTQGVTIANQTLKSDIQKRVDDFRKEAQESLKIDTGLPDNVKSSVTGSQSVEEQNDRYSAVFYGMEWYLRGAAHPSHTIDTFIFDYKLDKLVSQEDFFIKGSNYLSLLSQLSREDLKVQEKLGDMGFIFDDALVEEGTAPIASNFEHMIPLRDGLAIYFDEYQVAPYSAGPQQVVIPYSKLKSVIDPLGVLGMYVR